MKGIMSRVPSVPSERAWVERWGVYVVPREAHFHPFPSCEDWGSGVEVGHSWQATVDIPDVEFLE